MAQCVYNKEKRKLEHIYLGKLCFTVLLFYVLFNSNVCFVIYGGIDLNYAHLNLYLVIPCVDSEARLFLLAST